MSFELYGRVSRATTQSLSVLNTEVISALERKHEVEGLSDTYTVTIGELPDCTCPDRENGYFCKHLIYVLWDVYDVDVHSSPSIGKEQYADAELHEIYGSEAGEQSADSQAEEVKPWLCTIDDCDERFTQRSKLRLHITNCHGGAYITIAADVGGFGTSAPAPPSDSSDDSAHEEGPNADVEVESDSDVQVVNISDALYAYVSAQADAILRRLTGGTAVGNGWRAGGQPAPLLVSSSSSSSSARSGISAPAQPAFGSSTIGNSAVSGQLQPPQSELSLSARRAEPSTPPLLAPAGGQLHSATPSSPISVSSTEADDQSAAVDSSAEQLLLATYNAYQQLGDTQALLMLQPILHLKRVPIPTAKRRSATEDETSTSPKRARSESTQLAEMTLASDYTEQATSSASMPSGVAGALRRLFSQR